MTPIDAHQVLMTGENSFTGDYHPTLTGPHQPLGRAWPGALTSLGQELTV